MYPRRYPLGRAQLAYAVSAMAPFEERKARERQKANLQHVASLGPAGPNDNGRTTEKLAEKAGVGARTVNRAIHVREKRQVQNKHDLPLPTSRHVSN